MISVEALFRPIFDAQEELQVGWPDDEVEVHVRNPEKLQDAFRTALLEFRTFWAGASTVADIDVSIAHRRLDVRIARVGKESFEIGPDYAEKTEPARRALDRLIPTLAREAEQSGGTSERGYDGSYFDLKLPVRSVGEAIGLREESIAKWRTTQPPSNG